MNCNVIRDLLTLYADGLTSSESNQLIEDHVETCSECRRFLESLRTPMEAPPPEDDCDRLMKALRRRIRRRQIITIGICVIILLAILLGWYIHRQIHFPSYQIKIDSTDSQQILAEEPRVEVTGDEIELSRLLFTLPAVTETFKTLASDTDSPEFTQLSPVLFDEFLIKYLPEGASVSDILLFNNLIILDCHCKGTRIILSIGDNDGTGHVDTIRKTVATSDENRKKEYVYTSTYDVATKKSEYEKAVSYRKWFGLGK